MHMADALVSPAVGGAMLAVTGGAMAYSIKKVQEDLDESKIPLMGVMGAFVFTAQMINFSIPATGASGHLGGGMLLAILLGPYAGFITMASILLIQALFFGDGGILAYGCNVFNLGFYTCFLAYPLIYKMITRSQITSRRIFAAALLSAVVSLQLGSFSVVLETMFSGKTQLPFSSFLLLMQPIHLAIGIVEGLITAAVVAFIWKARPEIIANDTQGKTSYPVPLKPVLTGLLLAVIVTGGLLSWFASSNPDGLEWSLEKTVGSGELAAQGRIYEVLAALQNKTAFLPDYAFPAQDVPEETESTDGKLLSQERVGTSISGLLGGLLTLALVAFAGFLIRVLRKQTEKAAGKNI